MTDLDVSVPFEILERAVYFPDTEALVLADLHLGRGTASNVDAPLDDGNDSLVRLEDLFDRSGVDPDTVVIGGDLLHSFSWLPPDVRRDLEAIRDCIAAAGADLVVTPGNHDRLLEEVFDGECTREYALEDGETVVCHGHERPDTDAARYVVGHDHPAVSIDGRKVPCVLYGPGAFGSADVVMLPAFTRLAAGVTVNDMRSRDFQSPLVTDVDAFYPVVWDEKRDETLWFPPLGRCRSLL